MHDKTHASIWLIDFAKTIPLPANVDISHFNEWSVGNHEDGYLIGINNLIEIFEELAAFDHSAFDSRDKQDPNDSPSDENSINIEQQPTHTLEAQKTDGDQTIPKES